MKIATSAAAGMMARLQRKAEEGTQIAREMKDEAAKRQKETTVSFLLWVAKYANFGSAIGLLLINSQFALLPLVLAVFFDVLYLSWSVSRDKKGKDMITFDYHGVALSGADFPSTLQGWVAFSIAFAHNTHCRDKEAALELLMYEADKIIEQVKTGKAPER